MIGIFKHYDNCYGLSKRVLKNTLTNKKIVYLDFNITTAEKTAKDADLDINYIALLPPNIHELENRLLKRNTESPEKLQKRLEFAPIEIEKIKTAKFLNYIIINDDVKRAFDQFEKYIKELYPDLFE